MFSLRPSPSTLTTPCSLRGTVATETGVSFTPRTLTAPRPKRVVMPLMYYNYDVAGGCGSAAGSGGGGGGGGGSSCDAPSSSDGPECSSSTYAGVFEAGCDPAQVRASLAHGSKGQFSTPAQAAKNGHEHAEEDGTCRERSAGGALAVAPASEDDHETDCLFEMEGVRDGCSDRALSAAPLAAGPVVSTMPSNPGGTDFTKPEARRVANASFEARRETIVSTAFPSTSGRVNGDRPRAISGRSKEETTTVQAAREEKPPAALTNVYSRGASTTHLRTPRVIAPGPGRRCVAGGMYRLRLSTSC